MYDFIQGFVTEVIDDDTFDMTVESVEDGNEHEYRMTERILIKEIYIPGLDDLATERKKKELEYAILGEEIECRVHFRDSSGNLVCSVTTL